jgi:DNA-binding NarL/FixJ family response regulator
MPCAARSKANSISVKNGHSHGREVCGRQPPATGSMVERLSDRELEVFQLLGRALSTRQIADELHIGFKTVQAFHASIIEKLGFSGATELPREAIRWHDSQNLK